MKTLKKLLPLLIIALLSCVVFAFVGCSSTDNLDDGKDNKDDGNETPIETVVKITSFDGATIDGEKISLFVEHDIDSISLSSKVKVGDGCDWKLYYDKLGQFEIPTRVAADKNTKKLLDGNNTFYILVSSTTNAQTKLYTLTIYKSFAVTINYYDGDNLLKSETAYTGHEFNVQYTPTIKGYAFNYWEDDNRNKISKINIDTDKRLFANKTANNYTITLNTVIGSVLTENTKTIEYGQTCELPVPNEEGYDFLGWFYNSEKITDEQGRMLNCWQKDENLQLTAHWNPKKYSLIVNRQYDETNTQEESSCNFGSIVNLSATNNLGVQFEGWYDNNNNLLTTSLNYSFVMPAQDTHCIAKWSVLAEMQPFLFSSSENSASIYGVKDKTVSVISVPEYVTHISEGAFAGCNRITDLTLPFIGCKKYSNSSNTVFGEIFEQAVVSDNPKIENPDVTGATFQYSIKVNSQVAPFTEIRSYYFFIPQTLKNITIKSGNVPKNAFRNCLTIQQATLPNNTYAIGNSAFMGCCSLRKVNLGEKLTSIGESAFENCPLSEIVLPNTLSSIGARAFIGAQFSSVPLSNKTTAIGERAFFNCKKLTNIEPTENLTSIGNSAFQGTSISKFTFSQQLTTINAYAFADCSLSSVNLPTAVKSIGNCAFMNCPITGIDLSNITTIGNNVFSGCTQLSNIILTNNTISIGDYAFRQCSVQRIILPNQITKIGQGTFENCTNLKEIEIPANVIDIGVDAFNGCINLSKCSFIGNIKTIGYRAFKDCSSLLNMELPDTISKLETETFKGCTKLQTIKLPKYIKQLPSMIFENCNALMSLELGIIETIQINALKGCTSLQSIDWGKTIRWSDGRQTWWTYEITMDWLTNTKTDKVWTKIQ